MILYSPLARIAIGASALILAVGLLGTCGEPSPTATALGRPPIILILLDSLHSEHVSHLGYPRETTPAIDSLAADGVSFANAFAPAPYTLASVPSLHTGRNPDSHRVTTQRSILAKDEVTLAERLGGAGYRTVGIISQMMGGPRHGVGRAFEELHELWKTSLDDEDSVRVPGSDTGLRISRASDFPPLVDAALAVEDERPLFLYLHMLQPHAPYSPPEEYRDLWRDPEYSGPMRDGNTAALLLSLPSNPNHRPASPEDRQAALDLYDANLRWADDNLRQVFDSLRAAGLYDEALIVVTSDHGESFWQHGQWGHNDQLYDEMLRVPLVLKLPGSGGLRGEILNQMVSIVDVYPSVCELLDLAAGEKPLDGRSLATSLVDPNTDEAERVLLLRSHHRVPLVALRGPSSKTIVTRDQKTRAIERIEHYRVDQDSGEEQDLWQSGRREVFEQVQRLVRRLTEYGVHQPKQAANPTPAEVELLEMLGYTQSVQ